MTEVPDTERDTLADLRKLRDLLYRMSDLIEAGEVPRVYLDEFLSSSWLAEHDAAERLKNADELESLQRKWATDAADYLRAVQGSEGEQPCSDHAERCCRNHGAHSSPHKGCILR